MLTRLTRIPGDGDDRAEAILRRMPTRITMELLGSLDEADRVACSRYGARMPIVALRTGSRALLRDALLADAIANLLLKQDWRDTMGGQMVHHCVARELGMTPAILFGEIADRLPPGDVADLMRVLGGRSDITWSSFGGKLVATPDGPDLIPTDSEIWWEAAEPPDSPPAAKDHFQQFARRIARELGRVVTHTDVGLVRSRGMQITNSSGVISHKRKPDGKLPNHVLGQPFLIVAQMGLEPSYDDFFSLEAAKFDPQRRVCTGSVGF